MNWLTPNGKKYAGLPGYHNQSSMILSFNERNSIYTELIKAK